MKNPTNNRKYRLRTNIDPSTGGKTLNTNPPPKDKNTDHIAEEDKGYKQVQYSHLSVPVKSRSKEGGKTSTKSRGNRSGIRDSKTPRGRGEYDYNSRPRNRDPDEGDKSSHKPEGEKIESGLTQKKALGRGGKKGTGSFRRSNTRRRLKKSEARREQVS